MELKKLIYTVNEDGIAVITMNCMKNLNAINEQMADELMYVVDAAEKDPNVKVVILKGTGRAFSAGGDIGYFYELIQAGGEVNMDGLISKVGVVADGLKRMSKMVITSVCGAAAGAGVKKIIVATDHCEKNGQSKILKKCTLPLTGYQCVTDIVTERCYFEVTPEGLVLREVAPGYTVEDILACTDADVIVPDKVGVMQ